MRILSCGFAALALCGCGRIIGPYDDPYGVDDGYWADNTASTLGLVQGDAGDFVDFREETSFMRWTYEDEGIVDYSGDVVVDGGSVLVDVSITGEERMPIDTPMHFPPGVYNVGGVSLDVFVCPNGDGLSGPADDIVITKRADGTITVVATAENPEQNLDLDVLLEPIEPIERIEPTTLLSPKQTR